MRIRRVYIKKAGGEIASEACYSAWRGFSHLGYPLDFFESEDLADNSLRLDPLTLVVGGAVTVHAALRQIGVQVPLPLNVPAALHSFARRNIWETTLGAMRQRNEQTPVFIKPLVETKSFAGCVITNSTALAELQHLSDGLRLQAAEPVEFVSEWRYYIHRGVIIGVAHYKGEWSVVPDSAVVCAAVAAYSDSPIAYSLDFGVTPQRTTALVEANDAFALGAHGIAAVSYAKMLEDRWLEITTGTQ